MSTVILIHSILRWVLLLCMLYAIGRALMGIISNSSFTTTDRKAGLYLTSICDLQLLVGLIIYFFGDKGFKLIQSNSIGEVMKSNIMRFFGVEHIVMMLIAIIFIHIGSAKSKKGISDAAKHRAAAIYFTIGLIIILASIPWPFRPGFEGMKWM
jgi:hypothetical protein